MKLPGFSGGKKKTTKKTSKKTSAKRRKSKKKNGLHFTSLTWVLVVAIVVLMGGIGFLKWANTGTGQATLLTMGSDQAYGDVQNRIETLLVNHFAGFRPGEASSANDYDWPAPELGAQAFVRCRLVPVSESDSFDRLQLELSKSLRPIGGRILWGQKIHPEVVGTGQRYLAAGDELLRLDIGVSGKPTHTLLLHREGEIPLVIWGNDSGPSAWDQFCARSQGPVVALVIDDWGNSRNQTTKGLLKLPAALTMAVLPNLPYSRQFSLENTSLFLPTGQEMADLKGVKLSPGRKLRLQAGCFVEMRLGKKKKSINNKRREVILHFPMEPRGYPKTNPGEKPLLVGMDQVTISILLDDKLKNLPGIKGLNNHMGSAATSDPATMKALMAVLIERGFFFLDSLTASGSVAYGMAREAGIPALRNRIFLDYESENETTITANLNVLVKSARNKGFAVGIGHPHPATLNVLAREIPRLQAEGVRFVTISEMLGLMNQPGETP